MVDIERSIFGVHHGQLGAWVLRGWKMPSELVEVALHHHDKKYVGDQEIYAKLVMLSNHILKRHDIGDAADGTIPDGVLDALELGEYMVLDEAKKVMSGADNLNAMVELMLRS